MIITRIDKKKITVLVLDGDIDENFKLNEFLSDGITLLIIDCEKVRRINSIGIKTWIRSFQQIWQRHATQISYIALSPALVEQTNLISNFLNRSGVISVVLPYTCNSCSNEVSFVKTKDECAGFDIENPGWNCPVCGKPALEFDEVASDFLDFWK